MPVKPYYVGYTAVAGPAVEWTGDNETDLIAWMNAQVADYSQEHSIPPAYVYSYEFKSITVDGFLEIGVERGGNPQASRYVLAGHLVGVKESNPTGAMWSVDPKRGFYPIHMTSSPTAGPDIEYP